ncbi:MAG: type II toxin-antitoxin system VapC family toxin [Gemmatimonadaceae bacterium]
MRVLLDTHALLWWLAGDRQISATAKWIIEDETNSIFVSAASAWEVSTKHRLGKLPRAGPLVTDFAGVVSGQGFRELPIGLEDGQLAGSLEGPHRDPFDRMLIAQAKGKDLALVSNEKLFDDYGVIRIW